MWDNLNMTFTKGIVDRSAIKVFGIVHWSLQDDQDHLHHIAIHNAAWAKDLPLALFSSYQWRLSLPMLLWYMHEAVIKWMWTLLATVVIHQNNPTVAQIQESCFYSSYSMAKFQRFDKKSKLIQTSNCYWVSHLCKTQRRRITIYLHFQCNLCPLSMSNSPLHVVMMGQCCWAACRTQQWGHCLHG